MNSPVLVDAATVVPWQATGRNLVMLDCRFELSDPPAGEREYQKSHPAGALYAHMDRDLAQHRSADPKHPSFTGRHPLPLRSTFASTVGQWGITPATTVVTLDAHGGPYASRAWWMLRWLGHTQVYVLDGGLAAWLAAQGPMSSETPIPHAQPAYPTSAAAMPHIDVAQLSKQLAATRVVDARSADRFRGENEVIDPVAGHIPGAVNRFFKDNLDASGRFKAPELLRQEWQAVLGGASPTAVVHQCGSGVTACQNILAMMHAGLPASTLYAGSWSEWSADPARPTALGA